MPWIKDFFLLDLIELWQLDASFGWQSIPLNIVFNL
jgi:hypothetical protein